MHIHDYSPLQHDKLAAPFAMDGLVPPPALRTRTCAVEVWWKQLVRAAQVAGKVEQLGVIAELLEDVDRLEWLRLCAAQERLDLRRGNKEPVE